MSTSSISARYKTLSTPSNRAGLPDLLLLRFQIDTALGAKPQTVLEHVKAIATTCQIDMEMELFISRNNPCGCMISALYGRRQTALFSACFD